MSFSQGATLQELEDNIRDAYHDARLAAVRSLGHGVQTKEIEVPT
jgi:hypothetical protein